ncbi:cell division protein FtsL [Aliidiomarina maris]|uniref:Cell division protein FtsL n=1 Tax=Aliidiomarina maris TaxID=531312 RepID=A0A327WNX2_9GAMM|nr:cell division protein FtsL [Aliidiomarina maris]MBA3987585.1 cell division protein FtsL [Idiomarina sp.]MCL5050552.1 cell division protein FtsL [Bacillota bacterium]RAJ93914.1 cell division protein FtsL [Aliidiomarina maris]RUO27574.1 cell division protein FtsL [Aliidiomarina maris]
MSRLQHISLLKVIGDDIMRLKGLMLLSVLLLITAMSVVYLSHLNRELMAEREVLLQQRDALDVEWRHLVIEQTALAEHNRIEQLAQRNLSMQRPDDKQEVLVPWR